MSISRKSFLKISAGTAAFSMLQPGKAFSSFSYKDAPIIEKITVLRVPGQFYRSIAMNAYDKRPKGQAGTSRLARIVLSDGTYGLSVLGYTQFGGMDDKVKKGLKELIGTNPLKFYDWQGDTITGVADSYKSILSDVDYAFFETALLDVIGKIKQKPVWALFGDSRREGIDAYDGTLYFKDVELETGPEIIGELAHRIKEDGYKAIKMKVGRPNKWMKGRKGLERDISSFVAAREAVGENYNLMTDANNGYGDHFDWGVEFLKATIPHDMYWMEELFPEDEQRYKKLFKELNAVNDGVPIAEGENSVWSGNAAIGTIEEYQPWFEQDLFDFIQPDLRSVGFTNCMKIADMAQESNVSLVPHNWQCEMGKLMNIHLCKAHPNVEWVEDDRYENFAIESGQYLLRDGKWYAPDEPGWGITLSDHYSRFKKMHEETVIE